MGKGKSLVFVLLGLSMSLVAACGGSPSGGPTRSPGRFDEQRAFRDVRAQVAFGPRPAGSPANRRQVRFLARRLREAGARGVRVQRPYRNVVGRIPGSEPGTVVLGAHHDTKSGIPGFVGANDGASGVAVALELTRALARRVNGPSVDVVLFDAEEARGDRQFAADGDRGSRQYVRYARHAEQGSPKLATVRAMVLLDMVGDCDLQVPREESSDPGLYDQLAKAAGRTGVDRDAAAFGGGAYPIDDDHIPFEAAGIPALDVIDFTYGPGPTPGAWWHTPKDRLDKVCPGSLGTVGRATLGMLDQLGSG